MSPPIKNTTMKKKGNPIWTVLAVILTMGNLLIPIGILIYIFLYTNNFLGALRIGILFARYFPVAFILAFTNFKIILYYRSKLRRPHPITNALFFVMLFILSIDMIYYVLGFITAMFWGVRSLLADPY
jgi:hypothetical protein